MAKPTASSAAEFLADMLVKERSLFCNFSGDLRLSVKDIEAQEGRKYQIAFKSRNYEHWHLTVRDLAGAHSTSILRTPEFVEVGDRIWDRRFLSNSQPGSGGVADFRCLMDPFLWMELHLFPIHALSRRMQRGGDCFPECTLKHESREFMSVTDSCNGNWQIRFRRRKTGIFMVADVLLQSSFEERMHWMHHYKISESAGLATCHSYTGANISVKSELIGWICGCTPDIPELQPGLRHVNWQIDVR